MRIMIATCALACALTVTACSQPATVSENNVTEDAANVSAEATPAVIQPSTGNVASPATPVPGGSKVLTLEGLGDLMVGKAVPKDGTWAERGAQTGTACRTVSSPDYPGVYAILEGGAVRRITVGQRSDVKLIEGIGVGTTAKDVVAAFPGFRSEPHKYEEAPAKYLTAPNAAGGDVALRFEIGRDGKVAMMHVGTMPVLGYVEGCG